MAGLFAWTVFLNAALLFWSEPLYGKMLLPYLGGSPAVWNTCLASFQALLLLGYACAYRLSLLRSPRSQAAWQLGLLCAAGLLLPFSPPHPLMDPGRPLDSLLEHLSRTVALPFLALAANGTLIQSWYAAGRRDPYWLAAAANSGALCGLLGFPLLFERLFGIGLQARLWTFGYGLAAILTAFCAARLEREERSAPSSPSPSLRRRSRWLVLAALPSSLMLGATAYLSSEIAPLPLLWVLPLAAYLLTMTGAFARRWSLVSLFQAMERRRITALHGWSAAAIIGLMAAAAVLLPAVVTHVGGHLLLFSVAAALCHAELAAGRPESDRLPEFYLWMALGGALGGAFNAWIAPLIFSSALEYPLALACVVWLRPWVGMRRPGLSYAGAALIAAVLVSVRWPPEQGKVVFAERDFFGVHRVIVDEERGFRWLAHGNTLHGGQSLAGGEPLAYYHREGPLGTLFEAYRASEAAPRVAVVGLGAGAMISHGRPEERWTFYELDPAVALIARDRRYFTFLSGARSPFEVVLGDARLSLAGAPDGQLGLLIIDAFSSDAVPVHLLTREALELYARKLSPRGIVAFHVTNRYLDLSPALGDLAAAAGLLAWTAEDEPDPERLARGQRYSRWVAFSAGPAALSFLGRDPRWRHLDPSGRRPWSDDFSDPLSVLNFGGARAP